MPNRETEGFGIWEMLGQQRVAYIREAFDTPTRTENQQTATEKDVAMVAELVRSLRSYIPFIEARVRGALGKNQWRAELGDYYGERGLCDLIKRIQVGADDELHAASLSAFNEWVRTYFRCARMRLHDFRHPEGSHTLELHWSPATPTIS